MKHEALLSVLFSILIVMGLAQLERLIKEHQKLNAQFEKFFEDQGRSRHEVRP